LALQVANLFEELNDPIFVHAAKLPQLK